MTVPGKAVRGTWGSALLCAIVAGAAAVLAHWPVLSAQAMTFDDASYLTENTLVQNPSWGSVGRFFGEIRKPSTVQGYYHPLAMVSLMLDHAAGARDGHLQPIHRTSLALHALNVALIVMLLHQLFRNPWVAGLVGLLFGVHPLTVESIAWLAERKVVLATFFFLLALLSYVAYARGRRWAYVACLVAFVLGLLAKPTIVPLPMLLLVLDYWPLRRLSRRVLLEKVPFLGLSLVFGIITFISQSQAAFVELPHQQGLGRFLLTPCHNITFYLLRFLWPGHPSTYYPFPQPMNLTQPELLVGVLGTVVILALLVYSVRCTRTVLAGWLLFFLALLPASGVIGFTNVIMALRHLYLPALGFLLILTAALARVWQDWPPRVPATTRRAGVVAVVLLFALLAGAQTRQWAGRWQDTETLYRYLLEQTPDAAALHNDMGIELSRQKRHAEALPHLERAIAGGGPIEPTARYNYGLALDALGRGDEALQQYVRAVQRDPRNYRVRFALGQKLLKLGDFAGAAEYLRQVLKDRPEFKEVCHPLAQALARAGRLDDALPYLAQALTRDPNSAEVRLDYGNVLAMQGDWRAAVGHYQEALRLDPNLLEVRNNLGSAWLQLGDRDRAAEVFREAIGLAPQSAYAYLQLGEILLAQNQPAAAVAVFEAGVQNLPEHAELRSGLEKARAVIGP